MVKTTVYLPDDLKRRLEQTAHAQKRSEADVIRAALDCFVDPLERPRPRLPLFSAEPIDDWDEAMRGFGEH
jgi:hypothetical protein